MGDEQWMRQLSHDLAHTVPHPATGEPSTAPSAEIAAPTPLQLHARFFGGAGGSGGASGYETPILSRRIPFAAEAQSDVAAASQAAAAAIATQAVAAVVGSPPPAQPAAPVDAAA
jgi:hypothetical protein